MKKVLVSTPMLHTVIEQFRPLFERHGIELIIPPVKERIEEADLFQWVADVDGVLAGDDGFTARVLRAAPKLKVISKWGTGIDSIDQQACAELGIAVCNTPNAFTVPVADSVLGYILSFARGLVASDKLLKQGAWVKTPGRALHECTLGVIGVGTIGKTVVRRAAAFGMTLLGHDVVDMPPDFLTETGIQMVTRDTLLQHADFVSLNCDLNPTSHHLISHHELALMKPDAVLINTARGPVVDEAALIDALQAGQIGGVALDVFEQEPLPTDSPLRQMDNVLLAAHNANHSPAAWQHVHENTVKNLLDVLLNT